MDDKELENVSGGVHKNRISALMKRKKLGNMNVKIKNKYFLRGSLLKNRSDGIEK